MDIAIARAVRRVARDMHRRGGFPDLKPLLAALCVAGGLAGCQSVDAASASASSTQVAREVVSPPEMPGSVFQRIKGKWSYSEPCGWGGWGHWANFDFLSESDGTVRGTWGDGNSQRGESGELLGKWRDDKLFLRFCRVDVEEEDALACPKYGPELDYIVQRGDRIEWYQDSGAMGYTKYVEMERFAEKSESKASKECKEGD